MKAIEIIKYIMKNQKVSQERLGARIGKKQSNIGGRLAKTGNAINVETLVEYCKGLNCDVIIRAKDMYGAEFKIDHDGVERE